MVLDECGKILIFISFILNRMNSNLNTNMSQMRMYLDRKMVANLNIFGKTTKLHANTEKGSPLSRYV